MYINVVVTRLLIFTILIGIYGCGSSQPIPSTKIPLTHIQVSVCDTNETLAKKKAQQQLFSKVPSSLLQQKVLFQDHDSDNAYCITAYITKSDWQAYLNVLKETYASQMQKIFVLNDHVSYNKKEAEIDQWIDKSTVYNKERETLTTPMLNTLKILDVNRSRWISEINARPSLLVLYRPCDRNSNYRCNVSFRSQVKDESKRIDYLWDFGDNKTSKKHRPLHKYNKAGEYRVSLRVKDVQKAVSLVNVVVLVKASDKPLASFKIHTKKPEVGKVLHFTNNSYVQKGHLKSYGWSYGDGSKSYKFQGAHRYKKAGSYLVGLTVCSDKNKCASVEKYTKVKQVKYAVGLKKDTPISEYIKKHGAPKKQIVKKKSLMSAYLYKDIWFLVKRGKIECAVKKQGLSTNLMGQPKKCYWHEKHSQEFMVELE